MPEIPPSPEPPGDMHPPSARQASSGVPVEVSPVAGRIARIGFWFSIGAPAVLVGMSSLALDEVALLAVSAVLWMSGFGLSIVALSRRDQLDLRSQRFAIAGLIVTAVVLVLVPVWFLVSLFIVLSNW